MAPRFPLTAAAGRCLLGLLLTCPVSGERDRRGGRGNSPGHLHQAAVAGLCVQGEAWRHPDCLLLWWMSLMSLWCLCGPAGGGEGEAPDEDQRGSGEEHPSREEAGVPPDGRRWWDSPSLCFLIQLQRGSTVENTHRWTVPGPPVSGCGSSSGTRSPSELLPSVLRSLAALRHAGAGSPPAAGRLCRRTGEEDTTVGTCCGS